MLSERPTRLEALVASLPFAVDDFDAAAVTFVRWRERGAEADRHTAQLWAYCYVVWYFYGRFVWERTAGPSDLDWVIERSFRRVARSFETIREPDRFPQFVSVVCRNVLFSYRARRREMVEVDEEALPVPARAADGFDRALTRRLIERSIAGLPEFVGMVARMRLLEGASYQEIAAATGHPIATARTYYSKAVAKLRADPHLRALYDDDLPPDIPPQESRNGGLDRNSPNERLDLPPSGV